MGMALCRSFLAFAFSSRAAVNVARSLTPAPETMSSMEKDCDLKAERSEILAVSSAWGISSEVSERKLERKDERLPLFSTVSEDCGGDDVGEAFVLGTEMDRTDVEAFEGATGGVEFACKASWSLGASWCSTPVPLACACEMTDCFRLAKALASFKIADTGVCSIMMSLAF